MKKIVSLCINIILSLFVCIPFLYAQDTDRPWIYTDMTNQFEMHDRSVDIKGGDMILLSKISAISTTQNSYDVYAPFDGRIEEIHVELFDTVDKDTFLATVFTTELAAMMDSTPENSKNQTRRRWQDTLKMFYIKPEEKGIITKIHVTPHTTVYAGDRLFTVSRSVLMIGKNTEPIYNPLLNGMEATLEHHRTGNRFTAKLARFIPIKDKPYYYRLWLEVTDIKQGMAIGEQYDGNLTVAKSIGTRMINRKDLIRHNGKKYVIMEVETGLETDDEIELIRPITKVLTWNYINGGKPLPEKKKPAIEKPAEKTPSATVFPEEDFDVMPTVILQGDNSPQPQTVKKKTVLKKKPVAASKNVKGRNAGAKGAVGVRAGAKKGAAGAKGKGKGVVQPAKKTAAATPTDGLPTYSEQPQTDFDIMPDANPTTAKPMGAKVEGESDSKVYTSNDDVSSEFLESED